LRAGFAVNCLVTVLFPGRKLGRQDGGRQVSAVLGSGALNHIFGSSGPLCREVKLFLLLLLIVAMSRSTTATFIAKLVEILVAS
jgi:hypothetical protein